MPATYHQVAPGVWDRTFRGLTTEAKVVAFNVWTCRARRTEGLFELNPGHIAAETGLPVDVIFEALRELYRDGRILFDAEAEVVLDTWALKTIGPYRIGTNKEGEPAPDRRIKPAAEAFVRLPATGLKERFLALADEHNPVLAAAIRELLAESGAKALPSPPVRALPSPLASPIEGASRAEDAVMSRAGAEASPTRKPCDHSDWCGCSLDAVGVGERAES